MSVIVNIMKKMDRKSVFSYIIIALCFAASVFWIYHNYSYYDQPIAKVVKTDLVEMNEIQDIHGNKDRLVTQRIVAEIKNGEEKGRLIHLTNEYSKSGANDNEYHVGNELFVSINENNGEDTTYLTGYINNVKRDQYVLIVAWVFILTLLFVGKRQGVFSVISLAVNALLLSYALDIYQKTSGTSLLWICSISVVLFTVFSLLLVNGFNEKTYAAIIATLLGTFLSLFITYVVLRLTGERGLQYEEMKFVTSPYRLVFMSGLFIGSLGAVMDVAITMSSSIFGLYEENEQIPAKALKTSGLEIGKDIMGTMTNILFFAYISGSIPSLILYLKNASSLSYTLNMNLSLELARALAGGIGIVITIPIGLYTSIFLINRKRART